MMNKKRALIERILFATDFSACAGHAEEYVAHLAGAYRAAVDVLDVLEIYEDMYVTTIQDQEKTDAQLAAVARRLQRPERNALHMSYSTRTPAVTPQG